MLSRKLNKLMSKWAIQGNIRFPGIFLQETYELVQANLAKKKKKDFWKWPGKPNYTNLFDIAQVSLFPIGTPPLGAIFQDSGINIVVLDYK